MIIKNKKDEFEKYLKDESNLQSKNIEKLYIPENEQELSEIFAKEKSLITIYGGGTGVVGGATNDKGLIISTEKLKKIFIDKENKIVRVGAGVTLKELSGELKKYDLWYPVDSTEQTATIGGNFATNASGTRSFKFGCIRNFVDAASMILITGEKIKLKRRQIISHNLTFDFKLEDKNIKFDVFDLANKFSFKNSAGYYMKSNMDLMDLFIGSEGTLGVVTEVSLKVLKYPYDIIAFFIYFDERKKCFDIVKNFKKTEPEYKPLSIEYFDKNSLELLKGKLNNIKSVNAALMIEFLINDENDEEKILNFIYNFFICEGIKSGDILITSSKYKNDFIYRVREALPQLINEYIRQKGLRKISTDFAAENNLFDEMICIYDSILNESKVNYAIFGHIGDNNIHINFLPKNESEFIMALKLYDTIAKKIGEIGGTISAEHGVGKLKKKYLKYMFDKKIIDKMREIKRIFDFELRLNTGNIFD